MDRLYRLIDIFYKRAEERPLGPGEFDVLNLANNIEKNINNLFQNKNKYFSKKYFDLYTDFSASVYDIDPEKKLVYVKINIEFVPELRSDLEADINNYIQSFGYTVILNIR